MHEATRGITYTPTIAVYRGGRKVRPAGACGQAACGLCAAAALGQLPPPLPAAARCCACCLCMMKTPAAAAAAHHAHHPQACAPAGSRAC